MHCERCNYSCDFQSLFTKHCLTSKHLEIVRPEFKCEPCNFTCLYKSQYDTHCLTDRHNQVPKETYACEKCKFSTPYKSVFNIHCSSKKHIGVEKEIHRCESCNFLTTSKMVFEKHCMGDKHVELTTGVIKHNYKPTTSKIHVVIENHNNANRMIIKIRNDPIKILIFENDQTNIEYQKFAKLYIDSRYYESVSDTNSSWFDEFYNLDERHKLTYLIDCE